MTLSPETLIDKGDGDDASQWVENSISTFLIIRNENRWIVRDWKKRLNDAGRRVAAKPSAKQSFAANRKSLFVAGLCSCPQPQSIPHRLIMLFRKFNYSTLRHCNFQFGPRTDDEVLNINSMNFNDDRIWWETERAKRGGRDREREFITVLSGKLWLAYDAETLWVVSASADDAIEKLNFVCWKRMFATTSRVEDFNLIDGECTVYLVSESLTIGEWRLKVAISIKSFSGELREKGNVCNSHFKNISPHIAAIRRINMFSNIRKLITWKWFTINVEVFSEINPIKSFGLIVFFEWLAWGVRSPSGRCEANG